MRKWWDIALRVTEGVDTVEARQLHEVATWARNRDVAFRQRFADRWACVVCGVKPFDGGGYDRGQDYMVTDDVWAEAGFKQTDNACVLCLEVRLGRQLVIADFKPVLSNSVAVLMMKRGGLP